MDNNKQLVPREAIVNGLQNIEMLTPTTKDGSIQLINLISDATKKFKKLKEESYAFLNNKCKDCVNHFNSDGTLEAKVVDKTTKTYNDPKLDKLLAQEKVLKTKISARKKAVEALHELGKTNENNEEYITEQVKFSHYLVSEVK